MIALWRQVFVVTERDQAMHTLLAHVAERLGGPGGCLRVLINNSVRRPSSIGEMLTLIALAVSG